eukprot:CAMPEP_0206534506 /NCGR_PEP_ID=MMETSP0325_2-20121206/5584_1 /ASSEMBLY_ACC=CAM_ASM_000347 /TAXON_ID=2866 /ORGANISM="Crypthecodinium cohnii, Strain Seligo" /LENGTH=347 /DNA_ID=CAMNT_0054031319 /DNA_START=121 /DNA_END=1168 /DNA_ORIENTATION=-
MHATVYRSRIVAARSRQQSQLLSGEVCPLGALDEAAVACFPHDGAGPEVLPLLTVVPWARLECCGSHGSEALARDVGGELAEDLVGISGNWWQVLVQIRYSRHRGGLEGRSPAQLWRGQLDGEAEAVVVLSRPWYIWSITKRCVNALSDLDLKEAFAPPAPPPPSFFVPAMLARVYGRAQDPARGPAAACWHPQSSPNSRPGGGPWGRERPRRSGCRPQARGSLGQAWHVWHRPHPETPRAGCEAACPSDAPTELLAALLVESFLLAVTPRPRYLLVLNRVEAQRVGTETAVLAVALEESDLEPRGDRRHRPRLGQSLKGDPGWNTFAWNTFADPCGAVILLLELAN